MTGSDVDLVNKSLPAARFNAPAPGDDEVAEEIFALNNPDIANTWISQERLECG